MGYSVGQFHHGNLTVQIFLADIVKMLDSQPDLAPLIRRVRGGYLKIQGTWMPYEVSDFIISSRNDPDVRFNRSR